MTHCVAELRCMEDIASALANHLSHAGWKVLCSRAGSDSILQIRPVDREGQEPDEWIVRLQQDVDSFLSNSDIPSDHEPEWQTRRCVPLEKGGYADWEQSTDNSNNKSAPALLLASAGITLETGWAFGNGTHPATAGCVDAMIHLAGTGGFHAETRVLDIGTGTGILALTASVLGAGNITALDIDPESVKIATLNIQKNNLDDRIAIHNCALRELPPFKAHIITANLTPSVMHGLCKQMSLFMGSKTRVVAGGFMKGQRHKMDALFAEIGCLPEWSGSIAGWQTVIYRKTET